MIYSFAKLMVTIYIRLLYRLEVVGYNNMPKTGGILLCSNHIGYTDPVALAVVCKRKINFIAKKEIFKSKFVSYFLNKFKAFPVDRGGADMNAYKTAINLLKNGEVVGIFAQGTRVKELDTKSAKAGVALFALKSNVKILPVHISGNYKPLSKIKITFGELISLDEYKDQKIKTELLNEIAQNIMESIAKLANAK